MAVSVRPLGFGREARRFIDLLWQVYRDDPVWAPPLRSHLRDRLDPRKTPFLRYGRAQLFLAERDGRAVGRISAHRNPLHDRRWDERAGFFGFFECLDDPEAAQALLQAAEGWLGDQGVDFIRGPVSFTMNDEAGCLVDGFDTPAAVGMPHGRPYYAALIEQNGYAKVKDLWAYHYDVGMIEPRRGHAYEHIRAMSNVRVREFSKKHLQRDVRVAIEIFNDAWRENWGFVPVTEEEADRLAGELARFAEPKLTAIIEVEGVPAAMVVAVPNLGEVLGRLNGRLFPIGWLKFLWWRHRGPKSGRVILLGVKHEHRTRALAQLPMMLTAEIDARGHALGYEWAELGWVLEDNQLMNATLARTNARVYKTYRIYQKEAGAG